MCIRDRHPLGAIPASIIFGGLLVGADKMQRTVQVPSSLVIAINGLIVLFVVASDFFVRRRTQKRLADVAAPAEITPAMASQEAASD